MDGETQSSRRGNAAANIRFGPFELDVRVAELRKQGLRIRLQDQPFQILRMLLECPGDVVLREEIRNKLWPNDTVVEFDHSINTAVKRLRDALGESADKPRYIETLTRRGYRFIGQVEAPANHAAPPRKPRFEAWRAHREPNAAKTLRRTPWWASVLSLVVLAIVIAGITWAWRSRAPAPLPPEISALNGLSGIASYPVLRHDGSQIAYTWEGYKHQSLHIYVQPVSSGGGEPLQLTRDVAPDLSPVWSPDGTQIAFIRASERQDESGVYVIPSSGGRERLLTPVHPGRPESLGRQLAWCVNGSLFFVDRESDNKPFKIFQLNGGSRISVTEPPSDSFGDSDPTCSDAGTQLAFVRATNSWSVKDVFLQSSASKSPPRRLTHIHSGIAGLAWTRSKELVFASYHAGSPSLWRADVRTGNIKRISGTVGALYPTIALRTLAFSQVSEDSTIWALDDLDKPQPAKAHPLIASTSHDASPQLSPDGRTLLFASNRLGTFEIWVADADGRNPMRLTNFNQNPGAGSPRWSPNGDRIAFDCRITDNADVYEMTRDGRQLQRLTDSPAEDAVPTWSRDGQWIYFTSNRGGKQQIWKLPFRGGPPEQITKTGGFVGFEGPDGFFYYVKSRDHGSGIWRKPLDGDIETTFVPSFRPLLWAFWGLSAHGVYFVDAVGPNGELTSTLRFQSFDGQPTIVAHLDSLRRIVYPGLAVSTTGDKALYSQVGRRAEEIMIMKPFE